MRRSTRLRHLTSGLQTSGLQSSGLQTSGLKTSGLQTSGLQSPGLSGGASDGVSSQKTLALLESAPAAADAETATTAMVIAAPPNAAGAGTLEVALSPPHALAAFAGSSGTTAGAHCATASHR